MSGIDLLLSLPELLLAIIICVLLIQAAWEKSSTSIIATTAGGLLLSMASLVYLIQYVDFKSAYIFSESFIFDPYAAMLKLLTGALMLLALPAVVGRSQRSLIPLPECYALMLSSLLGVWVMASGTHMLTLYLGLELSSLSLYALAALDRDSQKSSEAAMKYFVMGAIASGILLYGISLVFGVTGSFEIADFAAHLKLGEGSLMLSVGLVLILLAVAFKFGLFPLHMWVPDLYQGAPAAVVAFVSSIPKIGVLALFTRFFVLGFSEFSSDWSSLCLYFGLVSVAVGNIIAIVQTSIKRLLGFSAIAHMGYLFLGLSASGQGGVEAAHFYVVAYALMSITTFGVLNLIVLKQGHEIDHLSDMSGLGHKEPVLSFLLLILMFSMAGIPPLVGFYAKFLVLKSLVSAGMIEAAALTVFFAIIGAFYYIKVVRTLYFEKPSETEIQNVSSSVGTRLLAVNAVLLLLIGFLPNALVSVIAQVIGNLKSFV